MVEEVLRPLFGRERRTDAALLCNGHEMPSEAKGLAPAPTALLGRPPQAVSVSAVRPQARLRRCT
jgi:hypothetical protein